MLGEMENLWYIKCWAKCQMLELIGVGESLQNGKTKSLTIIGVGETLFNFLLQLQIMKVKQIGLAIIALIKWIKQCPHIIWGMFLYDWCEERLEIQSIADDILAKFVPAHVNIFYCFGGIMVTSFIFQGGSGFALTIYYQPTVVEAFPSVQFILYHVNLGWFIKSIHRWSSGVMVLILILHIGRVYLTGGFKKPRELIWITGIILAVTTVSFGVTGYSLPWDQVGYWACKIVTSVPEALDNLIPGIGKISVLTIRGGLSVNQSTLTRLYSIHTFVLPLLTLILVIIHFSMLRKQGISGPL